MIWVAWRQHRAETLIALGMLAALAIFLLITRLEMDSFFQQQGAGPADCRTLTQVLEGNCATEEGAFLSQFGWLLGFSTFLPVLPLVSGALVGAPLVAREIEQHTHVLAWTQSISRTRWLSVKVTIVLGASLLIFSLLMAVLIWWHSPFERYTNNFSGGTFDFIGPVFPAAALLALTLGMFAGALTRRTVLAIFLTIALFLAIRLPVAVALRPNFEPPVFRTLPLTDNDFATPYMLLGTQDWFIDEGLLDTQGNHYRGAIYCDVPNETSSQCLERLGYRANYLIYQPADRFWPFQWMETGIYLAASALALGATFWLVRRRLS